MSRCRACDADPAGAAHPAGVCLPDPAVRDATPGAVASEIGYLAPVRDRHGA